MVVLDSAGRRLGTWAEAKALFAAAVKAGPIEFRNEAGMVLARTVFTEPNSAQGGTSLSEFWKRMGVV